jgi:neutral ceramidase
LLFALGGISLAVAAPAPKASSPLEWKVGVASIKITPEEPVWLAGYASRTAPSNGVDTDIFAKALSLDDGRGGRVVIVTLDLAQIPRSLRDHVETQAGAALGLKPHEILLNASHTHSAPQMFADRMRTERAFSRHAKPADLEAVDRYVAFVRRAVVDAVGESLKTPLPARLEFGQARAGFAMNRRQPDGKGGYSNNPNPTGPVDHDVPVLKVTGADGKIRAVLFGYACHNTVLNGSKVSGDYAGHAQKFLEESYAGATALFMTGCAGDQNPYPRRGMVPGRSIDQLVQDHGRALANAVSTAINAPLRELHPPLRAALEWVPLDYDALSSDALAAYQKSEHTPPVLQRAEALRRQLEQGQRPGALPCPVQVVRLGKELTLVAIGGEVVVDYSLRLKRELQGPAAVWVAGYSNDVFGYLGSRRVIQEGGYEGGGANTRILNHPGPFTLDAEEKIVGKVHELNRRLER